MHILDEIKKSITDKYFWMLIAIGPAITFLLSQLHSYNFQFKNTNFHFFFLIIVFLPILEEFIFRGILQSKLLKIKKLNKKFLVITPANTITSLLFASCHLAFHSTTWALLVFIPSLAYGYLRERHNNISSPILLHIWYNAGYFLYQIYG